MAKRRQQAADLQSIDIPVPLKKGTTSSAEQGPNTEKQLLGMSSHQQVMNC